MIQEIGNIEGSKKGTHVYSFLGKRGYREKRIPYMKNSTEAHFCQRKILGRMWAEKVDFLIVLKGSWFLCIINVAINANNLLEKIIRKVFYEYGKKLFDD